MAKAGAAGEPIVNEEIEWGRTYRHQKNQLRKPSISPTASPINFQELWQQYQRSKELVEIKELKRKLALKPVVLKPRPGTIDPRTVSKKKYYEYMATPHLRPDPPKEKPIVKKPPPAKGPCSPRLLYLALPTKVRVLYTWKDYQHSLPMDFITRLDELLHTDRNLDPKFARCYFKTLDRKRRKQRRKLRKRIKKRKKEKKAAESKLWYLAEAKNTVSLIVKFLQKEPLFALNFKQMMLSEALLTKMEELGEMKHRPARNTQKQYGRAIVDISDQLSVWIDTVVRYVDVQYTDSVQEIIEVSSLESLEGEEWEGEGEQEDEEPKRFSLPPLPIPEMEPLPDMPLITEGGEGEGGSTYGTTTALEAALGEVAAAGAAAAAAESEGGTTYKDMSLDGDALDLLIKVLSNSAPEMLEQLVNSDVLPGITYSDILERLKNLRNEVLAQQKRERQNVLADAMVAWAKANEPDSVDKKMLGKIQDTAGIISECLVKEGKGLAGKIAEEGGKGWESGEGSDTQPRKFEQPEGATESDMLSEASMAYDARASDAGGSEAEPSDVGGTLSSVGEASVSVAGEGSVSADVRTLETLAEEGESDTRSAPTSVTVDISEGGRGESEASDLEGLEGSAVGPWVVRPTTSKTTLLAQSGLSATSEKDQEFAGSLDMTGELNVLKGEAPSPELSSYGLGMTTSQLLAKQEADKKRAGQVPSMVSGRSEEMPAKSSIPAVIPGHKPSKVFEHQPDTICCLTLKVWATWLLEVAHNAHAWSKWLNDIINEVRRIAAVIRGDVKDVNGAPAVFYKEDWVEFSEKVDNMITSWRQYSMHVKDLTDKIVNNFRGKTVTCCPKCMEDNLIVDVTLAHSISQQLAEAMNTAGYWRRWLDSVVMETKRLTGAVIADGESPTSSFGTMELVELHQPHPAESEESLYEIEELDPNEN